MKQKIMFMKEFLDFDWTGAGLNKKSDMHILARSAMPIPETEENHSNDNEYQKAAVEIICKMIAITNLTAPDYARYGKEIYEKLHKYDEYFSRMQDARNKAINWVSNIYSKIQVTPESCKNNLGMLKMFFGVADLYIERILDKHPETEKLKEALEKEIKASQTMVDNVLYQISSVIEMLDTQEDVFETQAKGLESVMTLLDEDKQSSKENISELIKLVDDLQKEINSVQLSRNILIGTTSVAIVAVSVAACFFPILALSLILLVPAEAVSIYGVVSMNKKIDDLRKKIEEKTKIKDGFESAIIEIVRFNEIFKSLPSEVRNLKHQFEIIYKGWECVKKDLDYMSQVIFDAKTKFKNSEWISLRNDLKNASDKIDIVVKKFDYMALPDIKISDAKIDMSMSEKEIDEIFKQSNKLFLNDYFNAA